MGKAFKFLRKEPEISRGFYKFCQFLFFHRKMGKKYIYCVEKSCCFFVKVKV